YRSVSSPIIASASPYAFATTMAANTPQRFPVASDAIDPCHSLPVPFTGDRDHLRMSAAYGWLDSAGGCAHADPVAVRVGQNGVRRCVAVVEHLAPCLERGRDAARSRLRCQPHVDVPALTGNLVRVGGLEPHAGDPVRAVEDRVAYEGAVGVSGEQRGPER